MPRRKLSSKNVALFAGPSPATGVHTVSNIKQLFGIQTLSYDITTSNEDVTVFGQGAAISRESLEPPAVSLNTSWLMSDLSNENRIGMVTNGVSGAFAHWLDGTTDERNYFAMVAADGNDAVNSNPASTPSIGFGNGTVASYNFNAAVGSYPTSTVVIDALDIAAYADSDTEALPAINISTGGVASGTFTLPTPSGSLFSGRAPVIRPFDISVNLSGASGLFNDLNTACVQSVDIGVDFARSPILCLGSRYRVDNTVADTIPLTFSTEILTKDVISGRLSAFTCQTGQYSAIVTLRNPSCTGVGSVAAVFTLRGLTYEGQSAEVALGGDPGTTTLNFQGTIGGANDLTHGLFISGIAY